jgi:hypothetical protein
LEKTRATLRAQRPSDLRAEEYGTQIPASILKSRDARSELERFGAWFMASLTTPSGIRIVGLVGITWPL